MADGNKVFVSPGVYTSEKDLTFVAQSVGVTTLGVVGETLKGPAFEPIFIQSYDDFTTRFGGTSPTTYVDSQIPKYELGYIAKSYLSQSNQLFVTRVLGLSGYDAGPSFSVLTLGELDPKSFRADSGSSVVSAITQTIMPFFIPLTGTNTTVGESASINDALNADFFTQIPGVVLNHFRKSDTDTDLGEVVTLTNGTTLPTLKQSFLDFFSATLSLKTSSNTLCYTGGSQTPASAATAWPCPTVYQYGCIPSATTNAATADTVDTLTAATSALTVTNILGSECTDWTSYKNDSWYYALFDNDNSTTCCTGSTYSGVSYQLYISGNPSDISFSAAGTPVGYAGYYSAATGTTSAGTVVYSGNVVMDYVTYTNLSAETEYDGMVVLTLRSRGLSDKASGGPVYSISANTVNMQCTGDYYKVMENPFASFGISAGTVNGTAYTFKTSMSNTSQDYVSRVFGRSPFDKKKEEVPLFVEETYPALLTDAWKKGKVRGLQCCLQYLPSARNTTNTNTIAWYMHQWTTPETPWIVSELQGTDVYRLFKFISISDGTTANREIKISLINMSFERGEFDILVRDFYDTDANPNVLEKYTRCSLDPTKVSFVGRKIGTSTGEFELKSKYTMLYLGEGLLDGTFANSVPAGFEGYRFRGYGTCPTNPKLVYKTKYYTPGETVFDPPFGSGTVNNQTVSGGDKVSKVYLGVSNSTGAAYDPDFFNYKGKQVPSTLCTPADGGEWNVITKGFHMDSGATVVIGGTGAYTDWTGTTLNNKQVFDCGAGQFNHEPTLSTETYKKLRSRKFTVAPHGGFDGWDIYRKTRSNSDDYRMGLSGFLAGACTSSDFPLGTGLGTFKKLSTIEANTDYFAFLRGIETFNNPESVDINVFTTPGLDYVDNLGLVNEAIDMVETQRADSLYVVTTPDYNMFVADTTDKTNQVSPEEAVDNLEDSLIDSNYTATYYPWIQVRDTANNKQIYIPPTAEVMRNIALTDNISFPWFASAGYTRGLVDAVKARKKLTLDERDTLYVGRLNPIATFSDVGPIIWGNKTLQIRESALDRINVRRLLLQTRKLISAVSVRLIFEQNDDIVRQQFLDLVNPILDSIRRDRGLTDFRVVLSNDPEEIDRNEMNGKIYIKPTRALEYIFVEFLITPTGASFEDI
jgi:hypothetical protein